MIDPQSRAWNDVLDDLVSCIGALHKSVHDLGAVFDRIHAFQVAALAEMPEPTIEELEEWDAALEAELHAIIEALEDGDSEP